MTLAFKGSIKREKGWGNEKVYLLYGLEHQDLKRKVSADYSSVATEIATIAKALIDAVDNFIYYTDASIPATSITFKTEYDNLELAEALDELADRIDGVWNIEPDGLITLQKLTVIGTIPVPYYGSIDWTGWSVDTGATVTPLTWVGHTTAADFQPNNSGDWMAKYLDAPIVASSLVTFETWCYVPDVNNASCQLHLYEGIFTCIFLDFDENYNIFFYTRNHPLADTGVNYVPDTWFHIKITWIDNGAVNVYMDGVLIDSDTKNDREVDRVGMVFEGGGINNWAVLDAIGFDAPLNTDVPYTEGDDLKGLSNLSQLVSAPKYERSPETFNYIHLYGKGYIESDGDSKDQEDIIANGKMELVRYYPGCNDLTQLQNIAASLISKDGIATPPLKAEFVYKDSYFLNCAMLLLFTFDLIDRLSIPTVYVLKGFSLNEDNSAHLLLTNSTFQEGREYD